MKNILVTMSGGTTAVINSTLAGIIEKAQVSGAFDKIYSGNPGLPGFLDDHVVEIPRLDEEKLSQLKKTPGSGFIGTSRMAYLNETEILRLCHQMEKYKIGYFINIGGNGTLQQTLSLRSTLQKLGVKSAAVPKTVDNDLGDHEFKKVLYTPGFLSCVRYWNHKINILNQESLGAHSHDRVLVAQTFGRKTGFLAGSVRLSDPERKLPLLLLLPEDQRPLTEVLKAIKNLVAVKKRALVVLSEGYDVGNISPLYDASGQVMFGASRSSAAQLLINACNQCGIQSRGFIPGIDQRVESLLVSERDRGDAFQVGKAVINAFCEGRQDFLTTQGSLGLLNIPFTEIDFSSRQMPKKWLATGDFDVSDEYLEYLKGLSDFKALEYIGSLQ